MVKQHAGMYAWLMRWLCVCVQKYGLLSTGWEELPTWPFADFVFNQPSDWFQNCNKLKQAGFNGMKVDTDQVDSWLKMAPVPTALTLASLPDRKRRLACHLKLPARMSQPGQK